MIRRRIAILFVPALLILLVAGAFAWLMHSEPGARWILGRVVAAVPGQLKFEQVAGDLQTGLRIVGPAYRDESISLTADTLELRLDLGFWPPAITVHELRVGSLELHSEAAAVPASESSPRDWLPGLTLPVPVEFLQVRGDRIAWYGDSTEPRFEVRDLSLAAYWFRGLELQRVEAVSDTSHWQADLVFDLQAPHILKLDVLGSMAVPETADLGQAIE